MNPSYSTLLPSSIGDQLGNLVRNMNSAQIDGYADWWRRYARPQFKALVEAGMEPAIAIGVTLADGAPKPATIPDFRLRYQGAVTTLAQKRTQSGLDFELGFSFAGVQLGAGYQRDVDEASAQTSQASAEMTLTVTTVGTTEFTRLMQEAIAIGQIRDLPDFPSSTPSLPGI